MIFSKGWLTLRSVRVPSACSAGRQDTVPVGDKCSQGKALVQHICILHRHIAHLPHRRILFEDDLAIPRGEDLQRVAPGGCAGVRRISLGITTRPSSSMRRTIPVAFILYTLHPGLVRPARLVFVRERELYLVFSAVFSHRFQQDHQRSKAIFSPRVINKTFLSHISWLLALSVYHIRRLRATKPGWKFVNQRLRTAFSVFSRQKVVLCCPLALHRPHLVK